MLLLLFYQFNVMSDRFMVEKGDVIGWTNEEVYSPIFYDFDAAHSTRFYTLPAETTFPAVNDTVKVDSLSLPYLFSIAVEIIQR